MNEHINQAKHNQNNKWHKSNPKKHVLFLLVMKENTLVHNFSLYKLGIL